MSAAAAFLLGFVSAFVVSTVIGIIVGVAFFQRESAADEEFWKIEEAKGDRDDA